MNIPAPNELISPDMERGGRLPPDADEKRMVRAGAWVLAVGFCTFCLWAAVAPLDQGVHGRGSITVIDERKGIQHLQGGLVADVLVKEGEPVKKGQLLVRMNTVDAAAQKEGIRAQYFTLKATESRLLAELENKHQISFPAEILGQPDAADAMRVQAALFSSHNGALNSELSAIQENIAGQEHNAKGLEQSLLAKKEQAALIKQQLDNVKDLAAAGYFARNRVLELERTSAELTSAIESVMADIGRARSTIAEWRYKLAFRQQEDSKEIETATTELQKELAQTQSRLKMSEFTLQNSEIRSPADGVVVGLAVHAVGEVISPGARIMDIVPSNEPLIVEAKFPPAQIDKLRTNLTADLHFMVSDRPDIPVIAGEVMTVSADQLADPYSHEPYFLVRIKVQEKELQKLRDHKLEMQPGMPVDVLVRTGEQTFFHYLLEPIKKRMTWAFTE
ncbi:MAG: HlyD family type I secretion periplasmic adaptor subunit [Nitrosomonadales bacterium]|nr:HlyD family type I secretion periplasmic adaptor subunit [Nitrosomonadales bacterium]